MTRPTRSTTMEADWAVQTRKQEDVRHPSHVWADPEYAQESLEKLRAEYLEYLKGRSQPVSPETIDKYGKALLSLLRSLERNKEPLVLASLTASNVNAWIKEQRDAGRKEDGIASRLGAVKVFTNKYLYKHLEVTTRDLLAKVPRITPPERAAEPLTDDEIEKVLDAFGTVTFEDLRNRALVACYIATGLRFREILELPMSSLDRTTGEIKFIKVKGKKERHAWLSAGAMKHMRAYLRIRPISAKDHRLWVQADGQPLSYWGLHSVMRRLRAKSGIVRMHWHLFRHGFAQNALRMGADPTTVQEMLGHSSNVMTRRYMGRVAQLEAGRKMPRYSQI
jgi:site-specific recombinase XerD